MRRVLIVNDGGFGGRSAEKGDYDNICFTYKDVLTRGLNPMVFENPGPRVKLDPVVDIVKCAEAREAVNRADHGDVSAVIFVTEGMRKEAEAMQRQCGRSVPVIILSGAPPPELPITLSKHWVNNDMLIDILNSL